MFLSGVHNPRVDTAIFNCKKSGQVRVNQWEMGGGGGGGGGAERENKKIIVSLIKKALSLS